MTQKKYKRGLKLTKNELQTPKAASVKERLGEIKKKLPQDIIRYAPKTEKAMKLIEEKNTIIFCCDINANKPEIRNAIEQLYSIRPKKVNTAITFKGEKRAYAIFGKEHNALEIASAADII